MPEKSPLVGYGGAHPSLVAVNPVEQAQSRLCKLIRLVSKWMTAHGFSLTLDQTEVVISTKKRVPTLCCVTILESTKVVGLTLGPKVKFFYQIKAGADEAAVVVAALSRLIAKFLGPACKRTPCLFMTLFARLEGV